MVLSFLVVGLYLGLLNLKIGVLTIDDSKDGGNFSGSKMVVTLVDHRWW